MALYAGMELPPEAVSDYTPAEEERSDERYRRDLVGEQAVDLPEDPMLRRDLKGYRDYAHQVQCQLIADL